MSDPFISQIMIWPPNFAPRNWAFCQGQLLPISNNQALFALIGTIYGGDGRTTLGLPDLRGRVPIGAGRGPGLSFYQEGQMAGMETVTLTQLEMPVHNHTSQFNPNSGGGSLAAYDGAANQDSPASNHVLAQAQFGDLRSPTPVRAYSDQQPNATIGGVSGGGGGNVSIGNTGGSQAHENRQPFQVLNYVISLQGTFPSRN
jgi:microcystin-dependent protein